MSPAPASANSAPAGAAAARPPGRSAARSRARPRPPWRRAPTGRGHLAEACVQVAPDLDHDRGENDNRGLGRDRRQHERQERPAASAHEPAVRSAREGLPRREPEARLGLHLSTQDGSHLLGEGRAVLIAVAGAATEQPYLLVLRVAGEQEVRVRRERVVADGRRAQARARERGEAVAEVLARPATRSSAARSGRLSGSISGPSGSFVTFMPCGSTSPCP